LVARHARALPGRKPGGGRMTTALVVVAICFVALLVVAVLFLVGD
jgi:hypothetical protein